MNPFKLTCAGGILFYDHNGFWVITEQKGLEVQYTDIGGKYVKDDLNVMGTIRRELYEETYGLLDCTVSNITSIMANYGAVYLYSKQQPEKVVYVCLCVPIQEMYYLLTISDLSMDNIKSNYYVRRNDVVLKNPNESYKCLSIEYIEKKDLPLINLSYRLKEIFRCLKVDYGDD